MDTTIVTIYCLCDDFLKAIHYRDDPQVRLSSAEVMTVPLVGAALFSGNIEKARLFLYEYGYMPYMISKGRFNRRLHAIEPTLFSTLFAILAESFKERPATENSEEEEEEEEGKMYAVDSLPVAVCDNIRIKRCRLYPIAEHGARLFRGYIPSKRRYFYGLRVHLLVTAAGEPVEFAMAAGSESDLAVFKGMDLDLAEGSIICADKAYTDYAHEDFLEEMGLHLKAQRKKNSKRPMPAWEEFLGKPVRQYIETVFSGLSALFAKKIHAVTPRGFELKIVCSLLAFSVQCL